jgi:hypothetical protein
MGRVVWRSRAAAGSPWYTAHPEQQLVNSGFLLVCAWVTFLYGVSGLVFGYLPVFVLDGFLPLQGVPAVFVAAGSIAMGTAMGSHVVQRHWSTASAQSCAAIRRRAWKLAGGSLALGIALMFLVLFGNLHALARPVAVQPDAEWMLAPLPWAWPHALPLARQKVSTFLMVAGFAAGLAMLLFIKLQWTRLAFICMALVLLAAGAYFVGDSAYGYAATRSLAGIRDLEEAAAWRANPGLANAWLWLAWWGGATALAAGVLMLTASLRLPQDVVDRIELRR